MSTKTDPDAPAREMRRIIRDVEVLKERARQRRSTECERKYAPVRRMLAALNLDRKEGDQ